MSVFHGLNTAPLEFVSLAYSIFSFHVPGENAYWMSFLIGAAISRSMGHWSLECPLIMHLEPQWAHGHHGLKLRSTQVEHMSSFGLLSLLTGGTILSSYSFRGCPYFTVVNESKVLVTEFDHSVQPNSTKTGSRFYNQELFSCFLAVELVCVCTISHETNWFQLFKNLWDFNLLIYAIPFLPWDLFSPFLFSLLETRYGWSYHHHGPHQPVHFWSLQILRQYA